MAVVTQYFEAHALDNQRREVPVLVTGAADEAAAHAAVAAQVPANFGNKWFKFVRMSERLSETSWKCVAVYEKDLKDELDTTFSFDTGGGTAHITQSKEVVSRYGDVSEDEAGAIGWDLTTVHGVDIVIPVFKWAETKWFAAATVDAAYKAAVALLTGKTNNAAFKGFAEGEVLFMGASGKRDGDDNNDRWQIAFTFAASKNVTGLLVGVIPNVAKWGWEYLDIQYEATPDDTKQKMIPVVSGVIVHRVYDAGDFSTLLIGTT